MATAIASPHPGAIHSLQRPTATRLRSALIIPNLAHVLNELAQNSLDAGARRIDAWVSLARGAEGVRVEDDGSGVAPEDVPGLAEPHMTGKRGFLAGEGSYGFRGEALAAIGALALLEITTRTEDDETFTKLVKNGNTLYCGVARTELGRTSGTTVSVRDVFNAVPVRQAALAATGGSALAACRRVVETLALVHSHVRWTLWEDRPTGPRKVLAIQGGRSCLDVFRSVYGSAGVDKVQNVHVTSGSRRTDGFISLEGAVTRAHQHLYINGYPLESSELHQLISRRFAKSQFSAMASDLTDDVGRLASKRPAPRRLERHPVYVLDISLPPEDVDAAFDPRKSTIGYGDASNVKAFLVRVIDDFLRRQGFGPRSMTVSPSASPRKRARKSQTPDQPDPAPEEPLCRRLFPRTISAPEPSSSDSHCRTPLHESSPTWIQDILQNIDNGVLPIRDPLAFRQTDIPKLSTELTAELPIPPTDVTFPISSISPARVLRQVDRKFVPCILKSDRGEDVLVVFDQHAADERASVENILDALCEGFRTGTMPTTELEEDAVRLVLTRSDAEILEQPGVRHILLRWGIELSPIEPTSTQSDYVQVSVQRIPSLLDRLGRKQGVEMTRLLKLYLPTLAEQMGEIEALLADPSSAGTGADGWARVQRCMPLEMVELANSRACRGAIMFKDRLDADQCARLIARLAATRNPWICAHGRPTFTPLRVLSAPPPPRTRTIDWAKWK